MTACGGGRWRRTTWGRSASGRCRPRSDLTFDGNPSRFWPPARPRAGWVGCTITEGVEPNCLLLTGAGRPHLLIFSDPSLKSQTKIGATVTVVGEAKPGQITTCQQGIPFLVSSISVD